MAISHRERSEQFAIRSGGHGLFAGAANIQDGVTVEVSSDRATVQIGAGARWLQVYQVLDLLNITVTAGRDAAIGTGGFLTGGGICVPSMKARWGCDDVLEYEIVVASGEILRVSADRHPDLFVALKGGSNNFGVVTRFTMRTHLVGNLWAGFTAYPGGEAPRLLTAYSAFMEPANLDPYAGRIESYGWMSKHDAVHATLVMLYSQPHLYPAVYQNPTCHTGMTYVAALHRCVAKEKPLCPHPTVLRGKHCVLVGEPNCPTGTKWEATAGDCLGETAPECPPSVPHREGNYCVAYRDPVCKSGTELSIDSASSTARCCPRGLAWDGDQCVARPDASSGLCPTGTHPDGNWCKKPGTARPICAPGDGILSADGTQCIRTEHATCPDGLVVDASGCRSPKGPSCPTGTTLTGNQCVSDIPPQCKEPNTVIQHGQCVSRSNPRCPRGYVWDGKDCVLKGQGQSCGPDSTWDGTDCVLGEEPQCPWGTTLVDGQCLKSSLPICPSGTTRKDDVCLVSAPVQCDQGTFDGQDCVLDAQPACPQGTVLSGKSCVSVDEPECATGYEYRCGQCVSTVDQACPEDFTLQNGQCVSQATPECPPDSYPDGHDCVAGDPLCPDGTFNGQDCESDTVPQCSKSETLKDGKCVKEVEPRCVGGQKFDKEKGACVGTTGPQCPQGQKYHRGHCILDTGECIDYEFCPVPFFAPV